MSSKPWIYKYENTQDNDLNLVLNIFILCMTCFLVILIPIFVTKDLSIKEQKTIGSIAILIAMFMGGFIIRYWRLFNFERLFRPLLKSIFRRRRRLFQRPPIKTVLLVLFVILMIAGITMYVESEKGNPTEGLEPAGVTLIFTSIVIFLTLVNISKLDPRLKRILNGLIIIGAIATPIYLMGQRDQSEVLNNFGMLLYGVGLVISLSAIMVDQNISKLYKCRNRYLKTSYYVG